MVNDEGYMPEALVGPIRDCIMIANAGGFQDVVAVFLGGDSDDPDNPLMASVVHISGARLAYVRIVSNQFGDQDEQIGLNECLMN